MRGRAAARVAVAFSLALTWPLSRGVADDPPAPEPKRQKAEQADVAAPAAGTAAPVRARRASAAPSYQLPTVGKPRHRIGGGRRGGDEALPELWALVPEHVGQTVVKQPVLYWYVSDTSRADIHFELTLIDADSIEPLVDRHFDGPKRAGLQEVRLADHGVELHAGMEYQWSVALVSDPTQRSKDVVALGWIERVPEPAGLAERLAAAGPQGAPAVYAEAGLWYDALGALAGRVSRDPEDGVARGHLAGLLAQVGLPSL